MRMIHYGPLKNGSIDEEKCFCRDAILCEWVDEGGEACSAYAMPPFFPEEEVTVTELTQEEAETLAARLCATSQELKGGEWDWMVTND